MNITATGGSALLSGGRGRAGAMFGGRSAFDKSRGGLSAEGGGSEQTSAARVRGLPSWAGGARGVSDRARGGCVGDGAWWSGVGAKRSAPAPVLSPAGLRQASTANNPPYASPRTPGACEGVISRDGSTHTAKRARDQGGRKGDQDVGKGEILGVLSHEPQVVGAGEAGAGGQADAAHTTTIRTPQQASAMRNEEWEHEDVAAEDDKEEEELGVEEEEAARLRNMYLKAGTKIFNVRC
jgi:hypothetical protein